ncbi:MAG: hypothetical protein RLP44_21050 [Aggregatilineales bacterium]
MRRFHFSSVLILCLLLAACGSDGGDDDTVLPTRVSQAVDDATEEVTAEVEITGEATVANTDTPEPTNTATPITPTMTNTFAPTATFLPTETPTVTPTVNAGASATAAVIQAPRISTLTPIPVQSDGSRPTQPAVVAADVVITRAELQEQVNLLIAGNPDIESANLSMVSGENQGIRVQMSARGGQAINNGMVFIAFQISGDFVAIGVTEISVGNGDAPPRYQEIATGALLSAVIEAFDRILTERLGAGHNLQSLTIVDDQMDIMLLVPQN